MPEEPDPVDRGALEALYTSASQAVNRFGSTPHIFAFGSDDLDIFIQSQNQFDEEARERFGIFARHFIKAKKVHTIYTIIESWYVDNVRPEDKGVAPSEHPDRKEVLFCTIQKPDGKVWAAAVPITRINGVPSVPDTIPEGILFGATSGDRRFNFFGEETSMHMQEG